jgi:N-dimethylarginine dimethylaminohydrolase
MVPDKVLMCAPDFFDVTDSKNEFMHDSIGRIDRALARRQWELLRESFLSCERNVTVMPAQSGLEDMVFAANQGLPGWGRDSKYVVLARMKHWERQREVPFYEELFRASNYDVLTLPETCGSFEGQGDAIWHADLKMIWLGYGQRTDERVATALARLLQVPVIKLRLTSSRFYHLDTAFSVLSRNDVMIYPGAFDNKGIELIRHYFENVIEISKKDANNFACNSVSLGRSVILQKGSCNTNESLREFGYEPIEVELSEFMKSGGGPFCLKMMVY